MILNCAIVDDEPLALELLRSYVEKTSSRGGACLVP